MLSFPAALIPFCEEWVNGYPDAIEGVGEETCRSKNAAIHAVLSR